jgi:hypothetical protein
LEIDLDRRACRNPEISSGATDEQVQFLLFLSLQSLLQARIAAMRLARQIAPSEKKHLP